MMNAIQIENISKKFRLFTDKPQTLKDFFLRGGKGAYKDFYALKDVSLEIAKGSTVAFIGKNGSGKSTLLKLINRTMFADEGRIEINGKVSSLIELGAGFHPDLTGRENIFTNATIFGLTKEEVEAKLPKIIEFSELYDFIDNPVRTYSSGMYARLAFSVAIHVDPEILLVDEILSVGDMNFQLKCNNYMHELQKKGVTIVIVSHDMSILEKLCDYAFLFEHGQIVSKGEPHDVHVEYMERMAHEYEDNVEKQKNLELVKQQKRTDIPEVSDDVPQEYVPGAKHWGNQHIVLKNVKLLNSRGIEKKTFFTGEQISLKYDYVCQVSPDELEPIWGLEIKRIDEVLLYGTNTQIENLKIGSLKQQGEIVWEFSELCLLPGDYSLQITVLGSDNTPYDYIIDAAQFRVVSDIPEIGMARIAHEIYFDGQKCKSKF